MRPRESSKGLPELDAKHIRKISKAVKHFSGMNLEAFICRGALRFYSYSRSYQKRERESPLAFSKGRGNLYVQTPMIWLIADKECLAFVVLHEIGHLTGKSGEGDATEFADQWLKNGRRLSKERISEINCGWRKARRSRSVARRINELSGVLGNMAGNEDDLYEKAVVSLLSHPDFPK